MFQVTSEWLMPVNIAVAAVFILFFCMGWNKGLLRQIVSLAGTVVCFYGAWFFSSVLAKYIRLWPKDWAILQDTPYADMAQFYINQVCWLLAVFLVLRMLFVVIDKIAKGLSKIPVIESINNLGGGIVGLCEAALVAVVFTISLNTPLFQNGDLLQKETILSDVNNITGMLLNRFITPVLDVSTLKDLYEQGSKLSEEQRKNLEQWMEDNGFEEEANDVSCLPSLEYEVIDEF